MIITVGVSFKCRVSLIIKLHSLKTLWLALLKLDL